ncbi:hypothetical protein CGRA01v4_05571 [Colletotrichum graminicola]|nr:hypothetical protein CGRA01v4_05571 [Colletotrichum graminicola]
MLRSASRAGPLDIGVVLWRLAATWRNRGHHSDPNPQLLRHPKHVPLHSR